MRDSVRSFIRGDDMMRLLCLSFLILTTVGCATTFIDTIDTKYTSYEYEMILRDRLAQPPNQVHHIVADNMHVYATVGTSDGSVKSATIIDRRRYAGAIMVQAVSAEGTSPQGIVEMYVDEYVGKAWTPSVVRVEASGEAASIFFTSMHSPDIDVPMNTALVVYARRSIMDPELIDVLIGYAPVQMLHEMREDMVDMLKFTHVKRYR